MEPNNAYGKPLRFFNDVNDLLVEDLFLELVDHGEAWKQFTLKTWDVTHRGNEYRSLHRLYVEMNDLSEYAFANTYFYNFAHWDRVRKHPEIRPYYDTMRQELEAKLSTKALSAMIAQVDSGTATQATLKFLANREYQPTQSKQPKADLHNINEDLKRMQQ
jgi:hypothetical protein